MGMDTIQLEVKFESPPDAMIPELAMQIAVNGLVLAPDFSIDILALYNSTQESGEYFIWTCSCGIPECGSIYNGIRVAHSQDSVVWQVPKMPFEQATQFEFMRVAYVDSIMNEVNEYIRYFKSYSAAKIEFNTVPDWQLSELLTTMDSR